MANYMGSLFLIEHLTIGMLSFTKLFV